MCLGLYQQFPQRTSSSLSSSWSVWHCPYLGTLLQPVSRDHGCPCVCFLYWMDCFAHKTLSTKVLLNFCAIKERSTDSLPSRSISQTGMFNQLLLNVCLLWSQWIEMKVSKVNIMCFIPPTIQFRNNPLRWGFVPNLQIKDVTLCVCVCVCYLLGNIPPQNLVTSNDEDIDFTQEPKVWLEVDGDNSLYFTRCHLVQLEGRGLASSEVVLIHLSGGGCHLLAERLAGSWLLCCGFLMTWVLRAGIPKEREHAGPDLYYFLWPDLRSHTLDILQLVEAAIKTHPISRRRQI